MKIVSGGQTGVDRAALDAALEQGVPAGGWCPAGRLAEDGRIPDRYPLQELTGGGYRQRTRRNVVDSDGTAVIFFGYPSGGTAQTLSFCISANKPFVAIDGQTLSEARAAGKIEAFIDKYSIAVLNVAGPRASGEPGAYDYAKAVIARVLRATRGSDT